MKEKIRVIHYSDIGGYLSNLQHANNIKPEDMVCGFCRTAITATTFGSVTRIDKKLVFACNKDACLLTLTAPISGAKE